MPVVEDATVYAFDFNWVPRDGSFFPTPHGWLLSCWAILCKRSNCRKPKGRLTSSDPRFMWRAVRKSLQLGLAKPGWLPAAYIALKIRYPSIPWIHWPITTFPIQIAIPDFHTRSWELKSWLASFPYEPHKWWPGAMQFSGTLQFWYVDICR